MSITNILTALIFCWFPSLFSGAALSPGPGLLRILSVDRLQKSSMDWAGTNRANEPMESKVASNNVNILDTPDSTNRNRLIKIIIIKI